MTDYFVLTASAAPGLADQGYWTRHGKRREAAEVAERVDGKLYRRTSSRSADNVWRETWRRIYHERGER